MTERLTIALVAFAMFVLVAVMPASAMTFNVVNTSIGQGASVYIGEQDLNLTYVIEQQRAYTNDAKTSVVAPVQIGWWASAATTSSTAPSATFSLNNLGASNLTLISYSQFGPYLGPWYVVNQSSGFKEPNVTGAFFIMKDPQLSIDVWDYDQNSAQGGTSMSGKSVVQGDKLGFKIGTNMDNAINQPTIRYNGVPPSGVYSGKSTTGLSAFKTAWANIRVKTDQGNIFQYLFNGSVGVDSAVSIPLTNQNISSAAWYWGMNPQAGVTVAAGGAAVSDLASANLNWSTDANDASGQPAYPAGTYTVYVESILNGMYDNYQLAGAAYTGKTVSASQTVTLVSNTVKITANKDSVVRSKPFSVTVTGKPNTVYHVWIKGTSTLSGAWDNQPPMIAQNQVGVAMDSYTGTAAAQAGTPDLTPYVSGNIPTTSNRATGSPTIGYSSSGGYLFQNSGSGTSITGSIWANVAHGSDSVAATQADYVYKLGNGTYLYANVSLNDAGTRTVEWITTNWTKAQKYTIRVEQNFTSGGYKSDEVDVTVAKGAVTIVAAGEQSYYIGEEIKFSGTNTETQTTYLFISGPNLKPQGSQIQSLNPRDNAVSKDDPSSYQQASVLGDNTWSWKWGTANDALDAGIYTVWALSGPAEANAPAQLNTVSYGTVSIVIKKPFISASVSPATVAQGDSVFIEGTAQGKPSVGVQIWFLGKNFAEIDNEPVQSDGSFSFEMGGDATKVLAPGQYFVVAQHPMQNNQFDIVQCSDDTDAVCNLQLGGGTRIFKLFGAGSLQGSDAAEALVQAINNPNVDDTYTKLQFLVENPTITITPVGDRHVGDKFTIEATTNIAVDDEVLCQVYSSSFKPTQKSQSGAFSGASAVVTVTEGDNGLNTILFPVDTSTFKPDEYIVQETAVLFTGASDTALFNILEGAAPSAVPTVVATTVAPATTVARTIPPTTMATPTKTPTQPGFGALVALIGLGAGTFLVVRRH